MRYPESEACSKSELDIFSIPPTQVSIEEGVWDNIKPHSNFKGNTIIFDIQGDSQNYLALSETELWVTLKTTVAEADAAKLVAPVNNILHSLFSQIQIFFNNTEVENSNSNYPYKAYIENLLIYDKESKESFLKNQGWIKDTSGKFDDVKDANAGFIARNTAYKNKTFELCGRLHSNILNCPKYLLSNINVQLKLTRSRTEFCFMGDASPQISIEDTFLRVRRVKVAASEMLRHALELEKTTAKYPIKESNVRDFTLPTSAAKTTVQGICTGLLPNMIIIGFVETNSYAGTMKTNPFNFKNFGIQILRLRINGKLLPYSFGLEMDYSNNNYLQGYNTLFQGLKEAPKDITYSEFKDGYNLYVFNLAPDLCNSEHFNPIIDGSIDLEIGFQTAQTNSITLVVYTYCDTIKEIDRFRNVK
jgi:hypothetical protein